MFIILNDFHKRQWRRLHFSSGPLGKKMIKGLTIVSCVVLSFFLGALGLIVRAVLVFELVIVVRNFGKGLKEKGWYLPDQRLNFSFIGR